MVGTVGAVKSPPVARSNVFERALGLLSIYKEDGGKLRADLNEIVQVQKHNEEVFLQASDAVKAAQAAQDKAASDAAAAQKAWEDGTADLDRKRKELAEKESLHAQRVAEFQRHRQDATEQATRANAELSARAQEIDKRETVLDKESEALNKRRQDLDAREAGLDARQAELDRKFAAMRELAQ